MSLRTVARRYGGALFDVARRNHDIERVERQLDLFEQLLAAHPDLRRIFDTPAVAVTHKRALLDAVLAASGDIDGEVRQLLRMLADRDRLGIVPDITAAFADRVRQARGVVQAAVVTAEPMPEDQRASLERALSAASGASVTMTASVDQTIIGGLVARVGSVVYDGSVARQLARMKQRLHEEA